MASLLHYLDDIKSIENYYQFVDHGTWLEIPEKYLDQILNDFWVYLSHKEFYDKWKDELEMFDNTFEENEYEAEYTIMDTYHIKFKDGSEWFLDFMGREDPSGATDYNGDWGSKAGRFNRDWEQMNWNTDDLDKLIEMHNRGIVDYRELSPEEIKEIKSNTRITERIARQIKTLETNELSKLLMKLNEEDNFEYSEEDLKQIDAVENDLIPLTKKEWEQDVKRGEIDDIVKIDGVIYTNDYYDEAGKEIRYGNKENKQGFRIFTSDRYENGFGDAEIEWYEPGEYPFIRNDINYWD